MGIAIKVESLKKSFEGKLVVKGISFSVESGEIFGFLGPNGAGKTTSIKMMIGELPRDDGTIEILGMQMPQMRDEIKKVIGVVPDFQNLYDRLTVRQNLETFARLYGVPFSRIDELLKMVNLSDYAEFPTSKLSRGLRQRTLIARGLLHSPKVFFLDEPTSALDPHSALGIREVIKNLKRNGTTVFITTHYMEEADQLCDRIAIMHRGEIVAIDTPDALKLRYGRPSMRITVRGVENDENSCETIELPMNYSSMDKLAELFKSERVLKIHSQEATLEEVFLKVTGDYWKPLDNQPPFTSN